MTTDPVCGMHVDPAIAAGHSKYGGDTYSFCSAACKNKFDADPVRYAHTPHPVTLSHSTPNGAAPPAESVYTCPMHPEVRQEYPGACPKCGMALEPMATAAPALQIEYTCPMHPQIVR